MTRFANRMRRAASKRLLGLACDPYFSETAFLCNFNSPFFFENGHLAASNEGVFGGVFRVIGNVTTEGDGVAVFGLNGSGSNFDSYIQRDPQAIDLGGMQNFTFELDITPSGPWTAWLGLMFWGNFSNSVSRFRLYATLDGTLTLTASDSSAAESVVTHPDKILPDNRYHVAISIVNHTTAYIGLNGVVVERTINDVGSRTSTGNLRIGVIRPNSGTGNPSFRGQIHSFRLTENIARYTTNYEPPTGDFPTIQC